MDMMRTNEESQADGLEINFSFALPEAGTISALASKMCRRLTLVPEPDLVRRRRGLRRLNRLEIVLLRKLSFRACSPRLMCLF